MQLRMDRGSFTVELALSICDVNHSQLAERQSLWL